MGERGPQGNGNEGEPEGDSLEIHVTPLGFSTVHHMVQRQPEAPAEPAPQPEQPPTEAPS